MHILKKKPVQIFILLIGVIAFTCVFFNLGEESKVKETVKKEKSNEEKSNEENKKIGKNSLYATAWTNTTGDVKNIIIFMGELSGEKNQHMVISYQVEKDDPVISDVEYFIKEDEKEIVLFADQENEVTYSLIIKESEIVIDGTTYNKDDFDKYSNKGIDLE